MLPAWAGKKIRGPTVNRGPCPGVVLTLCAIMSTDQTGGASAAGAVRACLSWAWGRLCWCWCCPGAIAFRLYFTAFGDSSPSRQSLRRCRSLLLVSVSLLCFLSLQSERRGVSCFALVYAVIRCFISVFLRIFSAILCFLAYLLRYSLFLSV